jgi:hypothetical protein
MASTLESFVGCQVSDQSRKGRDFYKDQNVEKKSKTKEQGDGKRNGWFF